MEEKRAMPESESSKSPVAELEGSIQGAAEESPQALSQRSDAEESTPSAEDPQPLQQQEDEGQGGVSTGSTLSSSSKGTSVASDQPATSYDAVTSAVDRDFDVQIEKVQTAVVEDCLQFVEEDYLEFEKVYKQVLAKFNVDQESEGPAEISVLSERFTAVHDYLMNEKSASDMQVPDRPEPEAEEVASGAREDTTEKKRKRDSDASSEAVIVKKVDPLQDVGRRAEGSGGRSMVNRPLEEPTTSKTQSGTKQGDASSLVTLSGKPSSILSDTTASSRELLEVQNEAKFFMNKDPSLVTKVQRDIYRKLNASAYQGVNQMKYACDSLLNSAKCVSCVVNYTVRLHALCPVLLKISEAVLDEENLKTAKEGIGLAMQVAGLAVESLEIAEKYHKSAVSYLEVALGRVPVVQVHAKVGKDVLLEVVRMAKVLNSVVWGNLTVCRERAKDRNAIETLATAMSPVLERVKAATVPTDDVFSKLVRGLHYMAMSVALKVASTYTIFVTFEALKVVEMLLQVARDTPDGASAEEKAAGGSFPKDSTAQGAGAASSEGSEKEGSGSNA